MKLTVSWKIFVFCIFFILTALLLTLLILLFLPDHLTKGPRSNFIYLISFSGALVITLALCYPWARKTKTLIKEVQTFSNQLAKGDFQTRLPLNFEEEAGTLGESLNEMAASIEKQFSQLSEDRAHFFAILTGLVEGVLVLNRQGQIVLINAAMEKMFALSEQETKGRPFIEVIRDHRLNEFINLTLASGTNASGEITMYIPEERIFHVQASSVKGMDEKDNNETVFVFHDVTPLKHLERVRKDFVANVSHELRTPLASIKGYIEALLDGAKENPKQCTDFLKIVEKQSNRLNNIISDLLALSHIESGQYQLVQDDIPIGLLFEKTLSLLKPLAKKKSQNLSIKIKQPISSIQGDIEKMELVLINLLENAIKYTPDRGEITLEATQKENITEISVSDTGPGISKKDLPRIFERFYRVDRARSRALGGTGLGLSIVKHIVEAHGGSLEVQSELEKGSTFTILLPRNKGPI